LRRGRDGAHGVQDMKPGDHPEFFRFPAPEGRSRESTIRLDAAGRFWHEGRQVEHAGLATAFHSWIRRHPDDGRYILSNGYDWSYFTVDDAPYFVRAVRIEPQRVTLLLSDGTEEDWDPESSRVGPDGALYAPVKRKAPGGPFEAKFTQHAQASLAPAMVEVEGQNDGNDAERAPERGPAVRIGGRLHAIAPKTAGFG
jgi:hypothetical protein